MLYFSDAGKNIYCWLGVLSKAVAKSKARLVADKISKYERKVEFQNFIFQ